MTTTTTGKLNILHLLLRSPIFILLPSFPSPVILSSSRVSSSTSILCFARLLPWLQGKYRNTRLAAEQGLDL